jgi:hypothetical protein
MSNTTLRKARKAAVRPDSELAQRSDEFEVCKTGAAKRLLLDILEWLRPDQTSNKRPGGFDVS